MHRWAPHGVRMVRPGAGGCRAGVRVEAMGDADGWDDVDLGK